MASSCGPTERSHYFIAFILKYESSAVVQNAVLRKYITTFPDYESSCVRSFQDKPNIRVHLWFQQNALDLQRLNGGKFLI